MSFEFCLLAYAIDNNDIHCATISISKYFKIWGSQNRSFGFAWLCLYLPLALLLWALAFLWIVQTNAG
jgi:hypothetical protein